MALGLNFISVASSSTEDNSSWVYLVDWILALILGLAFVFYFNRLLGYILSVLLKVVLWKKSRIRINVESIRLNPLGGLIAMKNLTISTENQTVSILRLNLTWRFWIFGLTRLSEYYFNADDIIELNGMTKEENNKLPCRLLLLVDGLEVFMYNRTQAYDNMVDVLNEKARETGPSFNSGSNSPNNFKNDKQQAHFRYSSHKAGSDSISSNSLKESNTSTTVPASDTSSSSDGTLQWLLKLFPLRIRVKKGAFVMGNATTPSILVASYNSANSIVDITRSPSRLDNYRQFFDFDFEKFQISLKPNVTYDPKKYLNADQVHDPNFITKNMDHHKRYKFFYRFQRTSGKISNFLRRATRTERINQDPYEQWRGLKRYVGGQETDDILLKYLSSVQQYGKYSLVLDTVSTRMVYYYDSPGIFTEQASAEDLSTFPEFGVNLELSMATIHYGPWADKQRVPLQSMFFPSAARDSKETKVPREPGATRMYAGFKALITVRDEVIFRVPTRESSKDRDLLKNLNIENSESLQKIARPFGWLELRMDRGSTISSFNSFIATPTGWANNLACHFNGPELRTSVNHDILFSADTHNVKCDIGFPLKWDGECKWSFNNFSDKAKFFLLREHTMLMSDIVTDFASGDPTPYEYLRPFEYHLNWKVNDYQLYLNVNDNNIINNPLDFNSNKYLSFQGGLLDIQVFIPLNGPLSKSNTIDYKIYTPEFELILDIPPWHTANAFLKNNNVMGRGHNFLIEGSYTYFSGIEVNTSDFIVVRAIGDFITLKFYGFLIKYLFIVKENYMGDHKHFQTFEEYTNNNHPDNEADSQSSGNGSSSKVGTDDSSESDVDFWKIIKTENDMDILFTFSVRNGLIVLPYHIFDCSSHIGLSFDNLDVDMRFANYYSDLQADFSPLTGVFVHDLDKQFNETDTIFDIPRYRKLFLGSESPIRVDDFSVHAHRMFGLPPEETTYYCKWDFACREVRIKSDALLLKAIVTGVSNFALGFKDLENSLIYEVPLIPDAANFSFRCPHVQINLDAVFDNSLLVIDLESILVNFNDIANSRYSLKIDVSIPSITCKIIDKVQNEKVFGHLKTSLLLTNFCQKRKQSDSRKVQQSYLRASDGPTHRVPFIIFPENRDENYQHGFGCFMTSLSLPDASIPLNHNTIDIARESEDSSVFDSSRNSSRSSSTPSVMFDMEDNHKPSPTTEYADEDFTPQHELDPNFESDSLILDMGEVQVFITPRALISVADVIKSVSDTSAETLINTLHLEAILYLKATIFPSATLSNIRLVSPQLSLRFTEYHLSETDVCFDRFPKVPYVSVALYEPSIAFRKKKTTEKQDFKLVSGCDIFAAFHLKELIFSVSNPTSFRLPLLVSLKDTEAWYSKERIEKGVISFNLESLDIDVHNQEVSWLIAYIMHLKELMIPVKEAFGSDQPDSWRADFIHQITTAADKYSVEFDPGVLTKPAYILRACQDHVRFYDRWKLVTRLRHSLENLPQKWYEEEFNSTCSGTPANAYEKVLQFFSNWRNWEANQEERKQFCDEMFGRDVELMDENSDIQSFFNVGHIAIKFSEDKGDFDSVVLHDISLSAIIIEEKFKDMINLNYGIVDSITNMDLLLHIYSYESKISSLTLDMIPKILEMVKRFDTAASDVEHCSNDSTGGQPKNLMLSLVTNITSARQQLVFPYSTLDLGGKDITNSFLGYFISNFANEKSMNFSSNGSLLELSLWIADSKVFIFDVQNLSLGMATIGDVIYGSKTIDLAIDKSHINVLDVHKNFAHYLSLVVQEDLRYIKSLVPPSAQESSGPAESSPFDINAALAKTGNLCIEFHLNQFSWFFEALSPLTFSGAIYNNRIGIGYFEKVGSFESFVEKLDIDISLDKVSVFQLENSQMLTNLELSYVERSLMVNANVSLGYTKICIPQIVKTLELLLENKEKLASKIAKLKDTVTALEKNEARTEETSGDKEFSLVEDVAYKFNFTNDYVSVSTFLNKSRYAFEVEGVSLLASNISSMLEEGLTSYGVVPIHGEFSIPTARISVLDKIIPVGLSNMLDVNVSVKVIPDVEESTREANVSTQSLQVESEFCRICISPQTLIMIIVLADKVSQTLNMYPSSSTKSGDVSAPVVQNQKSNGLFEFSSIHVLAYNFCLGWLFGDNQKDYPGIILGAERFFAVTKKGMGKLSLMEGYLSVASGSTFSNFFSTSSEKSSLNRAFLPTVQLIYIIDGQGTGKILKVTIQGDELDVKFLSNSIIILEHTVNSVTKVQDFFKRRRKTQNLTSRQKLKKDIQKSKKEAQSQTDYIGSIGAAFSSFEFTATFAGSNVLLYRLNDDENETPPSLFLHSPAIKIASMYSYDKSAEKTHSFKSEVLASASDNTVYASCVPVVSDIVDGVKSMMKKSNVTSNESKEIAQPQPEQGGFNVGTLLDDIDLHVGFKLESQKLTLSCEPTAKVAAIVGLEGIYLQLNSGGTTAPSIVSAVQFESISASLQHIYSREVSGSVGIESILLTSSVSFDEVTNVLSSASFSSVNAYINIKQFQDLDLFKDIWFPKKTSVKNGHTADISSLDLESRNSGLASNKNISSRFKEVSTTYALPWVLSFIISDISLRVDFGQSLGNFVLSTQKLWVVSKKSTEWAQDLKIGVNDVSLISEGRLGGHIIMDSAHLHTAISWKIDGETTLDVPLILVSGGIDRLQSKISFDYHVFAIANIEGYSIDIFNQKNEVSLSKDHLFVTTKFDTSEIYITSLAASNFFDIFNTVSRMVQENKNSYKETLRDSSSSKNKNPTAVDKNSTANHDILETVKKLETKIEVIAGKVLLHIYPSSFDDSKVLVVKMDESKANFQQNEYMSGISNELELQFNDMKVSLSMTSSVSEDFIQQCSVNEFVEYAHKARGGTIFVFPRFMISMRTFQKYGTNDIEYLYQSSFGGTVDIRWNLGSINFIREMYFIHKKALTSRTDYKKKAMNLSPDSETHRGSLKEEAKEHKKSEPSPLLRKQLEETDTTGEIDEAINIKMSKVSSDSKYNYSPIAPPIIEAPQLKELGNATPPLEWFGLHRNKLPNATHQLGIVSLQKMIHEVESQYSKILGKA